MSFVPKGFEPFRQACARFGQEDSLRLRQDLHAGEVSVFALLESGELSPLPSSRLANEHFWYEAMTHGTTSVEVGAMYFEEVERRRPIFVRSADVDRFLGARPASAAASSNLVRGKKGLLQPRAGESEGESEGRALTLRRTRLSSRECTR